MSTPVLDMRDVWIHDARGRALVCGLDLWADAEHALGLVGESGSGKTLTARAALGVLPKGISVDAACIRLCGTDVYTASPYERRRLLGTQVGYVPQNTLGYLQPALRVHTQIIDGYRTWHPDVSRADALERAAGLLDAVGIAEPEVVLARYPGELSGGQRQRVNIAMALMGDPALIVADEPTAALDSITAVQVIDLLFRVARDRGVALLMISHDLGLVRERCDQVCVMYAGRSVEEGGCDIVLHDPGHPYTCGLLAAVPHGDPHERGGERLAEIPGVMPRDGRDRNACVFAPRCPLADEGCEAALPPLRARTAESDHRVACFHAWEPSRDEASVPAAAGQRDEGDAL